MFTRRERKPRRFLWNGSYFRKNKKDKRKIKRQMLSSALGFIFGYEKELGIMVVVNKKIFFFSPVFPGCYYNNISLEY